MSSIASLINMDVSSVPGAIQNGQPVNNQSTQQSQQPQQQPSTASIQQLPNIPQQQQTGTPPTNQSIQPEFIQNQPNLNNPNATLQDQNNSVQDLVRMLASGQKPQQQSNQPQQLQQPQQPQQLQQSDGSPVNQQDQPDTTDKALDYFLRQQDQPDFLRGIKVDEILQRIGEGDSNAMSELLSQLSNNTLRTSLNMMMQMMPDFIDVIKKQVMDDVRVNEANNGVWNDFIKEYPGFAPYKAALQNHLLSAMQYNNDPGIARQAVAQMYAGLVQTNNPQQQQTHQKPANGAFNFAEYLAAG